MLYCDKEQKNQIKFVCLYKINNRHVINEKFIKKYDMN